MQSEKRPAEQTDTNSPPAKKHKSVDSEGKNIKNSDAQEAHNSIALLRKNLKDIVENPNKDVVILCRDGKHFAHSRVLSRLDYFRKLFAQKSSKDQIITVDELSKFSKSTVSIILNFLYYAENHPMIEFTTSNGLQLTLEILLIRSVLGIGYNANFTERLLPVQFYPLFVLLDASFENDSIPEEVRNQILAACLEKIRDFLLGKSPYKCISLEK